MSVSLAGSIVSGASTAGTVQFQGLPCLELRLGSGDCLLVAHHGAHVLSWKTADGAERLYLSPCALFDGASPIRGGVPLCFPQFNMRALSQPALPKHGFARTSPWGVQGIKLSADSASASFALQGSAATRALWPHDFAATYVVTLKAGQLRMEFSVRNTGEGTGKEAWPFALALHTYLRVDDIAETCLNGLQGLHYWDGTQHLQQPEVRLVEQQAALAFTRETDRVYQAIPGPLEVRHRGGSVRLTQSASLPEAVVWNPAAERCATLADMPPQGWQQMLCVEAACINTPVLLESGAQWSGWQELSVV